MNIPFLHSAQKANEKIADMVTQLAEAKAILVDVTKEKDAAIAAFEEKSAQAASLVAKFDAISADMTAKLSESNAEIAALKTAAVSSGQQAAAIVAAQGIDPAKLPKASVKPNAPAAMQRAAFETLSPQDRVKHLHAGGILKD